MTMIKKVSCAVFGLAAVTVMAPGARSQSPQDQPAAASPSPSIPEAARRSREQSKSATKPSKVITDDDLDRKNIKPGAQGLTVDAPAKLETTPPTPGAVAAAASTPSAVPDAATTPAATDDPEIARLKEALAVVEQDADLSRREL